MQLRLELQSRGDVVFTKSYSVQDATSFGAAFADAWQRLEAERLNRATSVGALMEELGEGIFDLLDGAVIRLSKA